MATSEPGQDRQQDLDACACPRPAGVALDRPFCRVLAEPDGNILWVEPPRPVLCARLLSFGHGFLCRCPARMNVFHKHRI